jgi:hypothetical protein
VQPPQHPLARATAGSVLRPCAWRGHVLVTVLWASAVALSTRVALDHRLVTVMLVVHVIGLVIGLGAVLLVDWYGLVWMAGLRSLSECLRLAQAAHPLIWLGLILLLASGVGLTPDVGSPATWIKQVLVLTLLNNGVALRTHARRLSQVSTARNLRALPRTVRVQLLSTVAVSQAAWWGAAVLGFISASARSHQ